MLMCRSCGEFVRGLPEGETFAPFPKACPECGGTRFKHNESGEVIDTAPRTPDEAAED